MIKRLTWFVSGAVAGVAGVRVAKRRMKRAATHFTPKNIAYKVTISAEVSRVQSCTSVSKMSVGIGTS